jgi:hypothetical protein
MCAMTKSEIQPQNGENATARPSGLYSEAVAVAAVYNSRAGLALRRWQMAGVNPQRSDVRESLEGNLPSSTVGLHPIAKYHSAT